jgi:hypothetical protein
MITTLRWSVNVISSIVGQELVAFYVNLMMWTYGHLAVSSWMQNFHKLTMSAIFPRALPAAALVDARPEVVPEVAKFSVVCLALAGACAGLLAADLLPGFGLL